MGKLLKFRRRGPLPEVEERLALLSEELTLTTNFANAMIRAGNYHAAVSVIDEQRERLSSAEAGVVRAFALPARKRRRFAAATAGLAAALIVGSASFASYEIHSQTTKPNTPAVLQQVQHQLALVGGQLSAQDKSTLSAALTAIQGSDVQDPQIQQGLTGILNDLNSLPGKAQAHSGTLQQRIHDLAKLVQAKIPSTPEPSPKQSSKSSTSNPAPSTGTSNVPDPTKS